MQSFEEFDSKVAKRKTGVYGYGVDMFTRRDGSGVRVFRVAWLERNGKFENHAAYGDYLRKKHPAEPMAREWLERCELFPYSADGLRDALAFSKTVEPMREAFRNREC